MDAYRGPFPTPASREPVAVLPGQIMAAKALLTETRDALPELSDRPALIVWADGDIAFKEPERRQWEAIFPDHRTVPLAGAGHFLQEDAADEIVAAIRDWRGANPA
jgi:haloalkane dehalogenase